MQYPKIQESTGLGLQDQKNFTTKQKRAEQTARCGLCVAWLCGG